MEARDARDVEDEYGEGGQHAQPVDRVEPVLRHVDGRGGGEGGMVTMHSGPRGCTNADKSHYPTSYLESVLLQMW
ncbi:hypothetical protein Misp02_00400 [Microtetraspora sp. NBRC 16547]|nr:hypothetical protein Misp02_00400 [Microtetraspora sp. NBRC 16547]